MALHPGLINQPQPIYGLSSLCWFCSKPFQNIWRLAPKNGSSYCNDCQTHYYWSKSIDWNVSLIKILIKNNIYANFFMATNHCTITHESQFNSCKLLTGFSHMNYNLLAIPITKLKSKIINLLPFI